jgi:hypothetical protein
MFFHLIPLFKRVVRKFYFSVWILALQISRSAHTKKGETTDVTR